MTSTTTRKLAAAVTVAGLLLSAVPTFAAGGPSVTLSSTASSPTGSTHIPVTATISTSTTNFNASKVSVTNGIVGNFSGSGTSYSFVVMPTVAPGDPDGSHYVISIRVNDNAFDGNNPSNTLTIGYDPMMASSSTSTSAGAGTTTSAGGSTGTTTSSGGAGTQAITITGPNGATSDGSTVTLGSSTSTAATVFTFSSSDASSSLWCSIAGQSDPNSFFMCGSPQSYKLPAGNYRFSVQANNSTGTSSANRLFSVAVGSSTTSTTTGSGSGTPTASGGTSSGTPSSGSSPSGGTSATAATPSRSAEGGSGSAIGGPPPGNAIIPTTGSPVVTAPATPVAVVPSTSNPRTGTPVTTTVVPGPTVSRSSGGSALVGSKSPSTAIPGIPNTGSSKTGSAVSTNTGTTAVSADQTPLVPNTGDLSAAATQSGGGIPGWVWLVLAAIVLIAIGVWALRQPA